MEYAQSQKVANIASSERALPFLSEESDSSQSLKGEHMTHSQPQGFLALPPTGNGQSVLVLHAWWGLNDTMKAFCTRLAESGFVVFAPDLYHGKVADNIADAEAVSGALFENLDQARADVTTAAAFLNERAGLASRGLSVIGFSLGAFFALDLSVNAPEQIQFVVVFYGTRPGDYSNSKAAYLGHFAEKDEFEPQSNIDDLEESLRRAGRPVNFYRYSGTGHWFFEPDRSQAYNQAAANLAWDRTLAFLKHSSIL
jgi:carboxymethylenebutenolidase